MSVYWLVILLLVSMCLCQCWFVGFSPCACDNFGLWDCLDVPVTVLAFGMVCMCLWLSSFMVSSGCACNNVGLWDDPHVPVIMVWSGWACDYIGSRDYLDLPVTMLVHGMMGWSGSACDNVGSWYDLGLPVTMSNRTTRRCARDKRSSRRATASRWRPSCSSSATVSWPLLMPSRWPCWEMIINNNNKGNF